MRSRLYIINLSPEYILAFDRMDVIFKAVDTSVINRWEYSRNGLFAEFMGRTYAVINVMILQEVNTEMHKCKTYISSKCD